MHCHDAGFQFGEDPLSVDRFADRKRTVEIADALRGGASVGSSGRALPHAQDLGQWITSSFGNAS
jgi:hypothetical protein